jgi:hypothetical protein
MLETSVDTPEPTACPFKTSILSNTKTKKDANHPISRATHTPQSRNPQATSPEPLSPEAQPPYKTLQSSASEKCTETSHHREKIAGTPWHPDGLVSRLRCAKVSFG